MINYRVKTLTILFVDEFILSYTCFGLIKLFLFLRSKSINQVLCASMDEKHINGEDENKKDYFQSYDDFEVIYDLSYPRNVF